MKKSFFTMVAVVMMAFAFHAEAATWNPFQHEGRVKAHTIILTGNYVKARILAELAQYYTKQPVLLIAQDSDSSYQVYYLPNTSEARNYKADEFMELVTFINPKRVILLGGSDFVPQSFTDQVKAKYSLISLDSSDWSKNAASLGEILEIKRLQSQFDEYARSVRMSEAE